MRADTWEDPITMEVVAEEGNPVDYSEEVSSPRHYHVLPGVEVIDIIKARLSPEEYRGYLKGNILKYHLRADYKGAPEKDRAKARVYEDML